MTRRAVLLAVLVYLTLDVSLPWVPGVFVFEASDSVEGAQVVRGRLATEVVALPTLTGPWSVLWQPLLRSDLRQRMPPVNNIVRLARSAARCMPRAVCAPSPLSEVPH